MTETNYAYHKKFNRDTKETYVILRHPKDSSPLLERWSRDNWISAIDNWWQFVEDPDYVEITEEEALTPFSFWKLLSINVCEPNPLQVQLGPLARTLHDVYSSMIGSGFTDDQALAITLKFLQGKETNDTAR